MATAKTVRPWRRNLRVLAITIVASGVVLFVFLLGLTLALGLVPPPLVKIGFPLVFVNIVTTPTGDIGESRTDWQFVPGGLLVDWAVLSAVFYAAYWFVREALRRD